MKPTICKYCNDLNVFWEEIDGKWTLLDTQKQKHTCDLDKVIQFKIATYKSKYSSFDDVRFLDWLYKDYLAIETEEEKVRMKKYVAFKADIKKLNKSRRVGESIARYAALDHT